jgi:DNA polymerase-3 subunit alpha
MAFITVEDRTGEIEVIVFAKSLAAFGAELVLNEAVVITGSISTREEEDPKILLRGVHSLTDNASFKDERPPAVKSEMPKSDEKNSPAKLFLKVDSMESESFKRAQSLIGIFPGSFPVVFYDASVGKYLQAEGYGVELSDFVIRELRSILGDGAVILR